MMMPIKRLLLLNQHGVKVTVVDCRNRHQVADRARAKGIDVYCSAVVTKAIGKKTGASGQDSLL